MAINNVLSYLANVNIAVVITMLSLLYCSFSRLSHFRDVPYPIWTPNYMPIIWVTLVTPFNALAFCVFLLELSFSTKASRCCL